MLFPGLIFALIPAGIVGVLIQFIVGHSGSGRFTHPAFCDITHGFVLKNGHWGSVWIFYIPNIKMNYNSMKHVSIKRS